MEETNLFRLNKEAYLRKNIIIVGAGIAGLQCANRLKQLGFQNVKILEARDRVGGRIHGVKSGSNILELGAQWIHGEKNNSIYRIVKSLGMIERNANTYMKVVRAFSTCSQFQKESLMKLFEFLDESLNSFECGDANSGTSVLSYLNDKFNSFMSKYNSSLYDFLHEGYQWYCKFLLEYNGCENLSLLSLNLYNNYSTCDGDQHIEIKGGYSRLLNIFENLFPPDWLEKNKLVNKIDWSDFKQFNKEYDSRKVLVSCEDGVTYLVDHVVITIPLGCLKKNSQSLFNPPLSQEKDLAIQSIGFGIVNKIYLQFEKPFWDDLQDELPMFLVFHHHLKGTKVLTKDSDMNELSLKVWTNSINRFSYTPGYRNILCAWVAGEGAVLMESLSDNEVMEDCMDILENILEKKLPMPNKMLRSSWFSDPYAHGSYSYLSVECDKKGVLHSNLAAPVYAESYCNGHPVLMFAGEATVDSFYSTVHGAYDSGTREAERLFNHYSDSHIENKSTLNDMLLRRKSLREDLKIVIVGAGIAGLTCALHLANNNFCNITIVEAQEKIGGRVLSVGYNGSFLELGAQWIHGSNNALYDFSRAHNLLPSMQDIVYEGKGSFYTSEGQVIESSIVEEVGQVVHDAKLKIDNGEYDMNTKKSVKSFIYEAFNSYADECCDKTNITLKKSILEWYMKFEVIDNACDDLNYVALQSFTEWDDCPDELYHINLQNGFKSVLDALFMLNRDIKLHLSTPVNAIKWNENFKYKDISSIRYKQKRSDDNFPVVLECNDKKKFADCAIVTTSVGFLQENMSSFFVPHLPSNKQKALNKIGFGTVNKIFLIFDKPFWNPDDLGFHFVWKNDGLGKCERLCIENPWVYGITGFDVMKQNPNVLLGWIGGNEARLIESVKEKHVSSVCTDLLRIFLDNPDIPDPIKIVRSCWYSNPYTRGSYSNRPPIFYEEETTLQDIQQPLCCEFVALDKDMKWPIVLFAGEATDAHSFSSAHGAYNSGIKAAEDLIKSCSDIEIAIGDANQASEDTATQVTEEATSPI